MKFIGLLICCLCCFSGIAQEKETLKAGMKSADFSYQDVNGKTVSLKDLKGKYVYIDVWATWCMPCRGELPYLKELKEKMKDKNIHFVCISVDKDINAWKKMVKEENLGGIQLNAGGDKSFMQAFGIRGIPRFILLDPEGKIVNPEMSRPTQSETLDALMQLKGI